MAMNSTTPIGSEISNKLAIERSIMNQQFEKLREVSRTGGKIKKPRKLTYSVLIFVAVVGDILNLLDIFTAGGSFLATAVVDTILLVLITLYWHYHKNGINELKELQLELGEIFLHYRQMMAQHELLTQEALNPAGGQAGGATGRGAKATGMALKAATALQAYQLGKQAIKDPMGFLKNIILLILSYILPLRVYMMYNMYKQEKKAYEQLVEEIKKAQQLFSSVS